MSSVNVDTGSIGRIADAFIKLGSVANAGYSECTQALAREERIADDALALARGKISLLKGEIARDEQKANEMQDEYNRQLREFEQARAEGRAAQIAALGPDQIRQRANRNKKLLEELQSEMDNLSKQKKSFESSRDEFINAFKKIASGGSGGDDSIVNELEKTMEVLDSYVHTSFSSDVSAAYDVWVARRREQNAEWERQTRARMEHQPELGDE